MRSISTNRGSRDSVSDGEALKPKVSVAVADPRPGMIYYVMTEDLEPIDSAGYPAAWGNANGWLEPQELSVQMVAKAETVNNIAGKYGAKWTHYIAMPVLQAAGWAATQSSSGQWLKIIAEIKQSITSQSALGHEYALHMHSDYDPYLPGATFFLITPRWTDFGPIICGTAGPTLCRRKAI